MTEERHRKRPSPIGEEALKALALAYAGRYATSRAKLAAYLRRKLRERGWEGEGEPPVDRLVQRCAMLGYVDDGLYAQTRADGLIRRGYGVRRVAEALRGAGIAEEDAAPVTQASQSRAREAALRYARRKRIGPFGIVALEGQAREKAIAAMLRAGHCYALVREVLDLSPGSGPDGDDVQKS